ncbi:Ig-like domain-containing protein [Carnobacterium sp. ISL-102]|uniref:Ig-like domain-containing protein n=1 Tax=Carnobacterium sp. ISL-102 TaxID=2819142 RepID=UPI001BE77F02|nr:Ig-like domain-containing protein [Carnobacterium sp. ISL-102]
MKKIVGILLISSLLLSNTGGLVVYANTNTDLEGNNESSTADGNVEEPALEEPMLLEEQKVPEEPTSEEQVSIENEPLEKSKISTYAADVTAPTIDLATLKVSKTEVTLKDEVKISVKITDDVQMKNVFIFYEMPITKKNKLIYLTYNTQTKLYETSIEIDDTHESGTWKIASMHAFDVSDNEKKIYNNQMYSWGEDSLSSAEFTVSGSSSDTVSPTIDLATLKVSKTEATLKDEVKISVKITDDVQMKNVFIFYEMPITKKNKLIYLTYNTQTKLYETSIEIDDTHESGTWKIASMHAFDVSDNEKKIYNNQMYSWGEDSLSSAEFTVYEKDIHEKYKNINKLDNVTVLKENQTISNTTIDGDVYIGPDVVVTFNNVNVTGSIYVLGALNANSIIVSGSLSASYFNWGGNPALYNGTVVMSGSNSVSSMNASNPPVTEMPIRIDSNLLQSINGNLSFSGATVDVADMYVNNQLIDTSYDGKFIVDKLFINDTNEINILWNTVFGNTITKNYSIDKVILSDTGEVHHQPRLEAQNLTFNLGDKIDLLAGVSANDQEDGDLTDKIVIESNTIDKMKRGTYQVVYSVTDSLGAKETKSISVTLKNPQILSVGLNKAALTLNVEETFGLTANIVEQDDPNYGIKWESSNEKVAKIDANGLVQAIAPGNTTITVTAGDKSASSKIEIVSPLKSISLDSSTAKIEKGNSKNLTINYAPVNTTDVKSVIWTSSNPKVATVDGNGKVTALSAGTATITAKVGVKIATSLITVNVPLAGIKVNKENFTLEIEKNEILSVNYRPLDTTENKTVTWTSSNPKVATVDKTGKVTAVNPGSTTVSAKVSSKIATSKVSAIAPLLSISLDKITLGLTKEENYTLKIGYSPANTTDDKSAIWTSSNPKVATVDGIGKVTALSAGTATITAKVGAKITTSLITVNVPLAGIAVNKDSTNLEIRKNEILSVNYLPLDTTENKMVTWTSSNPKVATVDKTGKVTAVNLGSTTISAKVGSKIATSKVAVIAPLKGISLDKTNLNLIKEENYVLKIGYSPIITTDDKSVVWTSSNPKVATVDKTGKVTALAVGTATITAKVGSNNATSIIKVSEKIPSVSYSTHVQSYGWMSEVKDGKLAGTEGKRKRMEAIKVSVKNNSDLGITYSTHVEKNGWMNWVSDGALSGTSNESKRMEAIKIKLTGADAEKYDVYYRVHAEKNGWLGWTKNGVEAGTEGFGRRLEAIEIVIVEKGAAAPGSTTDAFVKKEIIPSVSYTTHVQSIGWQSWVKDGTLAGTSGKAKRLEGIKIKLENLPYAGGVQYKTHVQSYGWQGWSTNSALSGTSGKAKRLEAIQIQLTGEMAEKYDIYYRVHEQSYGWLGWAKNGESSGSEGKSKRLEAIEIRLIKKGNKAPGSTATKFINK